MITLFLSTGRLGRGKKTVAYWCPKAWAQEIHSKRNFIFMPQSQPHSRYKFLMSKKDHQLSEDD
jgi:hypothetical protein